MFEKAQGLKKDKELLIFTKVKEMYCKLILHSKMFENVHRKELKSNKASLHRI